MNFPENLNEQLEQRKQKRMLRELAPENELIDFCSNDYLGFAKSKQIKEFIYDQSNYLSSGSTGSRLISGNSIYTQNLERKIATYHHAEAALLYNSGYDANLGLISCIAQKQDVILLDELSHASIIDGVRLSFAKHFKFRHNNIAHLKELIEKNKTARNIFIIVESVYSMDGDCAPLEEISLLLQNNIYLIVDEAHATGVFGEKGSGLCNTTQTEANCFARIITYGKAMGMHGAAIVGSVTLCNYLINYSRSFIYTTALPPKSLLGIEAAYHYLQNATEQQLLHKKIHLFKQLCKGLNNLINSNSAIQCLTVKGNEHINAIAAQLQKEGFFIKAIKSPTVPENKERIRICLHSYNTDDEIRALCKSLINLLQ